ncbi:MAG: hypothetical protein F6K39_30340 [Okeania sp. SIO3B3]|nr:hypothetical protein [Okeania sp. SIO3B3]
MTTAFQGSAKITFGNPEEGSNSNPFYTGVGTSEISWGKVTNPFIIENGQLVDNNKIASAQAPTPLSAQEGETFKLGELVTWNSYIDQGTGIDSVPIVVELNLDGPENIDQKFEFDLDLSSSNNATSNGQWGGVYLLPETSTTETFEYDGKEYSIELVGFEQFPFFPGYQGPTSVLGTRFYTSYQPGYSDAAVSLTAKIRVTFTSLSLVNSNS